VELAIASIVALVLNLAVLFVIKKLYDPELQRAVALTYIGTISLRYILALFLWFNHTDPGFSMMFWGDSRNYDAFGAAIAEAWHQGGTTNTWEQTLDGKANSGFIYFVASIYYVFGRNTLLVQFLNGIIGALTAIVILEIGLLVYDRRVAVRAMLFTAFFPQMIFWSSAMYKDPAVMLCIGANILATLRLKNHFRPLTIVVYLVTASTLLWLRFYIFYVILAATLVGFLLGQRRGFMSGLVSQTFLLAGVFVFLMLTPVRDSMLNHQRYLNLQSVQTSRSDLAEAGSGFAVGTDVSTVSGAIRVLPIGIAYVLFAPFPWMVGNLRQLLALPDVLVWYALMPSLVRGLYSAIRYRLSQTMPILLFTTALTLAYGVFQGNVGTAYRQRTQIMMFYFLFIADGLKKEDKTSEVSLNAEPESA
jgi:hypothetical protein